MKGLTPKPKSKAKAPKRDCRLKKEVASNSCWSEKRKKTRGTLQTCKPTNETKGKRHFSIRRKTRGTDKNNEYGVGEN